MKNNRLKLALILFPCIMMTLILCACGGNVDHVRIETVNSELYSEDDINAAVHMIVHEFDRSWTGCTLTSISYAGDEITKSESEYYLDTLALNDADELIILASSFDVDETGGDGSLNPNSTYDGWKWILI